AIITYLKKIYIIVKEEWATYYINERLNFSYRIILSIELINCNFKNFVIISKV
ncbi:hypothetical protein QBC45DRAFT_340559, partial [Copromyces sp. CBS 386.78]